MSSQDSYELIMSDSEEYEFIEGNYDVDINDNVLAFDSESNDKIDNNISSSESYIDIESIDIEDSEETIKPKLKQKKTTNKKSNKKSTTNKKSDKKTATNRKTNKNITKKLK
jgi:phosphorylcholine metabolism protein LicD